MKFFKWLLIAAVAAFFLAFLYQSFKWYRGEQNYVQPVYERFTAEDEVSFSDGGEVVEPFVESEPVTIEVTPEIQQSGGVWQAHDAFGWIKLEIIELEGTFYRPWLACGPHYWDSVVIMKDVNSSFTFTLEGVELQQLLHRLDSLGPNRPCPGGRG